LLLVLPRIQAIFIMTTSTIAFRTGALPRWLSLVGYLAALGMLLLPLLIGPVVFIFPIWLGVVSVFILVRRRRVGSADGEVVASNE
jgi:hypothetical protein